MKLGQLLLLILLMAFSGQASEITLAWNASLSPATNITYKIYGSTNAITSTNFHGAEIQANAGTNLSVTISDFTPAMWTFTATAFATTVSIAGTSSIGSTNTYVTNRVESDPSNFVLLDVPKPPAVMRTVILQVDATLTGTNWVNSGFFRVGIQ